MIKAILFVICTVSVVAQELNWTPVTEAVPGGNMKIMLAATENLAVVFTNTSSYVLEDTSKVWSRRPRPMPRNYAYDEVSPSPLNFAAENSRLEFCTTKSKDNQVIIWGAENPFGHTDQAYLYYTIDTCKKWKQIILPAPIEKTDSITLFGGKDGYLYLFCRGRGSTPKETMIYRTVDTLKSVEYITSFQGHVRRGNIVQTADSSLIFLNSSYVGKQTIRMKNGICSGVPGFENQRCSRIVEYKNNVYISTGRYIFQLEGWKKIVTSYRVDLTLPGTGPYRLLREMLRVSKNGDVLAVYTYDFGVALSFLKKSSNSSFVRLNNVPHGKYLDVGSYANQWLFLDDRGVWALNKENKLLWSSEGIIEHGLYCYAVNNSTESVVAINKVGDVFYKSLKDSLPWKNITTKFTTRPAASGTNVVACKMGITPY